MPVDRKGRGLSRGIWRHASLAAVVPPEFQRSLGEGDTPLLTAPRLAELVGMRTLYLKLDSQNPTGSFKDRGTAAVLATALARGATHLIEDSSGNAGASAAAYAARSGIKCTIYAPASAPAAKLRQAEAFGATIVAVQGNRTAVTLAARGAARSEHVYHLDHNANPLFVDGMQTLAFELIEQLGVVPPLVLPVGGGSLLAGLYQGFSRLLARSGPLQQRGSPIQLPALFAVQSEACDPLVRAFANGWSRPLAVQPQPTVAGGISIADPPRGAALLEALRRSNGGAVAVSEEAIRRWGTLLARLEGVYAEPTAAAAVAGAARLVAAGQIPASGAAVVVITGTGLKDSVQAGRG